MKFDYVIAFLVKNRYFFLALFILWMIFSGAALWHLPQSQISVVFAEDSPSKQCQIKQASNTYHFRMGQKAYTTSFDDNKSSGLGTALWINDLWVLPSQTDKPVKISKIIINQEEFSAERLQKCLFPPPKGLQPSENITIKNITRFKLDDPVWNKSLNKKIMLFLGGAFLAALLCCFAGYFLLILNNKFIGKRPLPLLLSASLITLMLYTIIHESWTTCFITVADTLVNLNNLMIYTCTGKWHFDAFITAGLAYLYPLAVIIGLYQEFSPENIMHSIVMWNLILASVPIIVIFIDRDWSIENKLLLTAGFLLVYWNIPIINTFHIRHFNMLYGELFASCVFTAAVILYCRSRKFQSIVIAGFLFAISIQIKQVFLIFTLAFVGGSIVSGLLELNSKNLKNKCISAGSWLIGYAVPMLAKYIFTRCSFDTYKAYLQYVENVKNYNYEGAVQISLWDHQFLCNLWTANWRMLVYFGTSIVIILILLSALWSIYHIFSIQKDKTLNIPAFLFISSFAYLLFWFLTGSVPWRNRHLWPVYFVFLFGLLFFIFLKYSKHLSAWKNFFVIALIGLFFYCPSQEKKIYEYPNITDSYPVIYNILQKYHREKALVVVDDYIPQIFIRGYRYLSIYTKTNRKQIKPGKTVIWAHKTTHAPFYMLKKWKKTELFKNDTWVIEKFTYENVDSGKKR